MLCTAFVWHALYVASAFFSTFNPGATAFFLLFFSHCGINFRLNRSLGGANSLVDPIFAHRVNASKLSVYTEECGPRTIVHLGPLFSTFSIIQNRRLALLDVAIWSYVCVCVCVCVRVCVEYRSWGVRS